MKILKKIYYRFFVRTAEANANYLRRYSGAKIGNNCHLFRTFNIGSEPYLVEIGDNVTITAGVKLITHDGSIKVPMGIGLTKNSDIFGKIIIGNNVFIGVNSIVLPNLRIGNNVIVGAGSIVTRDIPDNSVFAGNPAKHICTVQEFFDKNKSRIVFSDNLSGKTKENYVKKNYMNKDKHL